MCTVLLPPGVNPTAVNKRIISFNKSTVGLKLIDNLIVSPETSTVYGKLS
jgi:hypothetical protein